MKRMTSLRELLHFWIVCVTGMRFAQMHRNHGVSSTAIRHMTTWKWSMSRWKKQSPTDSSFSHWNSICRHSSSCYCFGARGHRFCCLFYCSLKGFQAIHVTLSESCIMSIQFDYGVFRKWYFQIPK